MPKLFIVVDYQNDFVDGQLGFSKALELDSRIAEKIKSERKSGSDIAFTFDTHYADYLSTQEGKNLPVEHCIKGSDGWQLFGETAKNYCETDKCFYKSAFGSSELFDYLRSSSYDCVELAGVVSNICVVSNAILAKTALPEARIVVDAQCTASNDEKLNSAALDIMRSVQIEILD